MSVDNGFSSLDWPEAKYSYGYQANICSFSRMDDIFSTEEFDAVVHLASKTQPRKSMKSPRDTLKDNIFGALNILELSKRYDVKRVVMASSCGVAGDAMMSIYLGGSGETIFIDASGTVPLEAKAREKAVAIAASIALPPSLRTVTPASEASSSEEVTIPFFEQ